MSVFTGCPFRAQPVSYSWLIGVQIRRKARFLLFIFMCNITPKHAGNTDARWACEILYHLWPVRFRLNPVYLAFQWFVKPPPWLSWNFEIDPIMSVELTHVICLFLVEIIFNSLIPTDIENLMQSVHFVWQCYWSSKVS